MTLGGSSPAEAPADSIKAPESDAALAPTTADHMHMSPGRLHRQVLSPARGNCYVQEDRPLLPRICFATGQVTSQACIGRRVISIAVTTQQM